ncbi:MAG: flagellar protein FlaG [Bacillus sp. (in: Bacteria)]|nr:flagellar protein FlaG [Bacillus sp. (in: firmicutes)]MCM1426690.1 flagellar protein FlaG [Eubacterium sp.]
MAIEPLNSVMTFQAQPVVKAAPTEPVNTEVPADGQTVNVDTTTASVAQTQAENEQGGSEKNGGQQQSAASQAATENMKRAVAEMNRKISNSNEEAVFGVHEKTNRITIKIVDKDTKEVIKEFPPEKTLDMIAKVWEMAGILVDEKR